jgi:Tfp pilus assembly protein PilO
MDSQPTSRFQTWHVDACGMLASAGLLAALGFGVIAPIMNQQSAVAAVHDEIADLERQRTAMDLRRSQLQADLDRATSAVAETDLSLEPVEQVNRRVADIVDLASECGMVIHETRTDEPDRAPSHSTVPVELSGDGSYSNCAMFLRRLARALPDVKVVAFDLSGNPRTREGDGTFEFDLAWYAAPSVAHIDAAAP